MDITEWRRFAWSQKWLLSGCMLIGVVGSALLTVVLPKVYQARVLLSLREPKLGVATPPPESNRLLDYAVLAKSNGITQQVVDSFSLNNEAHGISALQFARDHLSVEVLPATSILQVTVSLGEPDIAAEVANFLAARVIEKTRELQSAELSEAQELLGTALVSIDTRTQELQKELLEVMQTSLTELNRSDLNGLLLERRQLSRLELNKATQEARLVAAEEQLAQRSPRRVLRRSIDADPALMAAAIQSMGEPQDIFALTLQDEQVDPIYDVLEQYIVSARTQIAALNSEREKLVEEHQVDVLPGRIMETLFRDEAAIRGLQAELQPLLDVSAKLRAQYEESRIMLAAQTAQLDLMDLALPPRNPASPRPVANLILGIMAGLAAGIAIAVMRLDAVKK